MAGGERVKKGIIKVNIPKSCRECDLRTASGYCIPAHKDIFRYGVREEKAEWCPIKPLPEKAHHEEYCDNGRYDKGWNECLEKIEDGG